MIPLALFLLGCAAGYVGTVQAAFSALMRLPLRLSAERHGAPESLSHYLGEPLQLFVPARLLQALTVSLAMMLALVLVAQRTPGVLALVLLGVIVFVIVFEHLVPLLIVRRSPERVLGLLLPSFHVIATALHPITTPLVGLLGRINADGADSRAIGTVPPTGPPSGPTRTESRSAVDEHEERKLLQSVVEFGDTLVGEVMTPRPDIVAVKIDTSLAELRELFVDQQYSRLPVYKESLDNILGFVFVKDLVVLADVAPADRVITELIRPAYVVPEAKRVAELLKEFQRKRVQSAIVHDEYGGTAGLVTIEDLLEEIVGEIRDEYDVEAEPVVDEGNGSFVFAGTVGVDDVAECLHIDIERRGFETVGGYLLARLGRVPRVGETLDVDQVSVEILEGERRRVQRVRMRRRAPGLTHTTPQTGH